MFLCWNHFRNSENCCFIKFLEKFQKIYHKFLLVKRVREAPGRAQGDPPCHHTWGMRDPAQGAPRHGVGPLALHLLPCLSLSLPLTREKLSSSSKHEFLLLLLPNFDLFAQPLISAEIWSNCSLVCDSSVHPNRILFSKVFLEYFAAVGDMSSELACLYYAWLSCFDA